MCLRRINLLLFHILLCCLCFNNAHGQSVLIKEEQQKLPFLKDSTQYVKSLNKIGMLYHLKDPDSCFYYGMKAKAIATRIHYKRGQTGADNVIAVSLYLRGMYSESLELHSKVLSEFRQQSDTLNEAIIIMNISTIYGGIGDTLRAKAFSLQAIQTGKNQIKDSLMSLVYSNYCMANPTLPEDSVRFYLAKSQEIANRYKDVRMQIVNMHIEAYDLIGRGRKKEAMPLIVRSLSESQKAGIEYLEINSLGHYAEYYADNPDSVLHYYHRIYQLVQEKGYNFLGVIVLKVILANTEKKGNKEEIIKVHGLMEKALATENQNLKKFIGDYVKYSNIQDDNVLLNKDNELKTTYLIAVVVFLAIVFGILLWVWHTRKQIAAKNKTISAQNSGMQLALSALEESQEENTRIMKIVAHDLRNPMAANISIASLLIESEDLLPENKEILELMRTANLHSLELIADLLNLNTTSESLKKELVEMHTLLQYCVDLLKFKAADKKQKIVLQTQNIVLDVNKEKIWRVISNLIVNAIKFSHEGSVISVQLHQKQNVAQIIVKDNGIGIPENLKDHIFNIFSDARRQGTLGEESFGLGLAISRQIITAHGGKIWADSSPGSGTTFYVELPMYTAS